VCVCVLGEKNEGMRDKIVVIKDVCMREWGWE